MSYSRKPAGPSRLEQVGGSAGEPADIEALKKRFERLSHEKTKAETRLDGAQEKLEELKKKARETYGTDDLAELKERLERLRRENLEKRAAYLRSLERIEEDLRKVDERYGEATREGERT